jgi:hypothetical protein
MMAPEDLEQIRTLVREEIAAAEERMAVRQDAAEQRMAVRQDAAIEVVAGEISALRNEFSRRFAGMQERLDNLAPVVISTDARMAAFTRSVDRLIGAHEETAATQAAQQ